ncbi:hypothetical protein KPL74_04455 [Bacillus sp. NP157]|nr:hypothetical protein KPL74_04455 [Bacillus sp. NP157]
MIMEDLARRQLGYALSPSADFAAVELIVHRSVQPPVEQELSHALADTPTLQGADGDVTVMTGAMVVGAAVATRLAATLAWDNRLTLVVPHAFAIPSEVESLQAEFEGRVVAYNDQVLIRFGNDEATPESIRRAILRGKRRESTREAAGSFVDEMKDNFGVPSALRKQVATLPDG